MFDLCARHDNAKGNSKPRCYGGGRGFDYKNVWVFEALANVIFERLGIEYTYDT